VIVGRKRVISRRKTEERSMGKRERSGWVKKIFKKKKQWWVYLLLLKTKIKKKIKWSWLKASHVALLYSFS
jgi:hypothetical protein